ncbi:hypothetical protein N7481_009864 [Penicillium waksmanii]|uniref:uncharacterized protein n=1 Tax=Penicillium waksmanii TaxID=69791 RepID=UPI002547C018|nr:uncharacterized protein N7481_009864 [Penicillium waksmanii]KAJ5976157.1 hypothetical protein N7481_009864 [Penicillium waksmanii]
MDLTHLNCAVHTPDLSAPPSHSISRWSDTGILGHPASIIIPETEDDIRAVLEYAGKNGLTVFPAGGGHGSFIPITSKTLYLDMKKFAQVHVDKDSATATVGGGAITKKLIQECTSHGFYTTWVNSQAVGVVGSILGGGNPTMAGLHGMMIDNVLSARLITAGGKTLELSPSSKGDELALFQALCGAGNGLGVITSLTMRIYPISDLQLSHDGVFIRRLIFPAPMIDLAATAFTSSPSLAAVMICARAPSTAPKPGAPMIILTATYYGPAKEAERATSVLFDEEVVSKAINAQTEFTPVAQLNDASAPFDAHGGFKNIQSTWMKITNPEAIKSAFEKWLEYTTKHEDAKRTALVLSSFNTKRQMEIGASPEGHARYFDHRDRGLLAIIITWFGSEDTASAAATFAEEIKTVYKEHDSSSTPRTILNNIGPTTQLSELHTEERIRELKRLGGIWDPLGLFWKPWNRDSE